MNEISAKPQFFTRDDHELARLLEERDRLTLLNPERILPILRPCQVKVLLVADGNLDFALGDFGLRTFVETLLTMPWHYVRFQMTLAHIRNVSDDQVMLGDPRIVRSLKPFKFDDPAHFTPGMYDQVWLFGIETSYFGRGNDPSGQPYPNDRLGDRELRALSEFIDNGGGLFATGDHGSLGVCLSGSVPRVRSMRLWGPPGNDPLSEVSMTGPRRNDTNRIGPSSGSQFNDQSDVVPQTIAPRLYQRWPWWWRAHPHPLLCGPRGMIRVLPDHPHEGECVLPADTDRSDTFAGFTIVEYPPGSGGSPRPLPEVIATSSVLAGTTSGIKQPTEAHTFGAISAYDGHRAAVGRVVTDATWHHFVNVNLIGDPTAPAGDPKRQGFLATPAGQAHFEEIKTYYRNIAVWLSRPALLVCMRRRILWGLLWHHRVLEAVLTQPELPLQRADVSILYAIGRHARDVLGFYAGQCQTRLFPLDLLAPILKRDLLTVLDPWAPLPKKWPPVPEPDPLPWFDPEPILDAAVGGALVALREHFPEPDVTIRERVTDADLDKFTLQGVQRAVDLSFHSVAASGRSFGSLFSVAKDAPKRASPRKRKK